MLYAEGIDGKPDYQTAAKWFRKAADYGVADSQYNLGILYARGIGVEQNLAEAYKWFALAAREGDTDAAKKRDDVAARLDQQSLTAAQRRRCKAGRPSRSRRPRSRSRRRAGGWDSRRRPPARRARQAQAARGRGPKLDLVALRAAVLHNKTSCTTKSAGRRGVRGEHR